MLMTSISISHAGNIEKLYINDDGLLEKVVESKCVSEEESKRTVEFEQLTKAAKIEGASGTSKLTKLKDKPNELSVFDGFQVLSLRPIEVLEFFRSSDGYESCVSKIHLYKFSKEENENLFSHSGSPLYKTRLILPPELKESIAPQTKIPAEILNACEKARKKSELPLGFKRELVAIYWKLSDELGVFQGVNGAWQPVDILLIKKTSAGFKAEYIAVPEPSNNATITIQGVFKTSNPKKLTLLLEDSGYEETGSTLTKYEINF